MSKHLKLNAESPLASGATHSPEAQDSGLSEAELRNMIAANRSSDPEFARELEAILEKKIANQG